MLHEHVQVSNDTCIKCTYLFPGFSGRLRRVGFFRINSWQGEWRTFSKVLPQTYPNFTKFEKESKVHLIQSHVLYKILIIVEILTPEQLTTGGDLAISRVGLSTYYARIGMDVMTSGYYPSLTLPSPSSLSLLSTLLI